MKYQKSLLASLCFGTCSTLAAPPTTIELGAIFPSSLGGQLVCSQYLGESVYWQARLEQGLLKLNSRLSAVHHGLLGIGFEEEFSSHLFARISLETGLGFIYNRGARRSENSEWLALAQVSPEIIWFPFGRFGRPTFGLNLGLNLQTRRSLFRQPLPDALSGVGAQVFAGVVL